MLRRIIIAIATVAALSVSVGGDAFARGGHGGGGHGGYRGHGGGGWGVGAGIVGGAILGGMLASPYYYGAGPYYSAGCYRTIRVRTAYGLRWRRVWVCQ
jgi:hypothetical protein